MSGGADLTIDGVGTVFKNLQVAGANFEKGAQAAAHSIAAVLMGWAKTHHLYVDRTGNLTNSTQAWVESIEADLITLFLSAKMEYAVFLEFAHDEKYQWLRPAIDSNAERIKTIIAYFCGVS